MAAPDEEPKPCWAILCMEIGMRERLQNRYTPNLKSHTVYCPDPVPIYISGHIKGYIELHYKCYPGAVSNPYDAQLRSILPTC